VPNTIDGSLVFPFFTLSLPACFCWQSSSVGIRIIPLVHDPRDEHPMSPPPSVSTWLRLLRAGDPAAAQPLWERYYADLVRLAHAHHSARWFSSGSHFWRSPRE
jgi:hypothetical protein